MSLLKSISSNVKIIQDKILTIAQENVSNSKLVHAKDFLDEKMNTLWLRAKQFKEELSSKSLLKINLSEIDNSTKWKIGVVACLTGLLGASAIYNTYAGDYSDPFRDNSTNPIDDISRDGISQNVPGNNSEMKDSSSSAISLIGQTNHEPSQAIYGYVDKIANLGFPEFSIQNGAIALVLIGGGAGMVLLNRMSGEKKPQEPIKSHTKLLINAPEENSKQQTTQAEDEVLPPLLTPPGSDDEEEEESEDRKPLLLIYPNREEKELEKPLLLKAADSLPPEDKADKTENPERQEEQKASLTSNSISADAKAEEHLNKEEEKPEKPLLLTDAKTLPSKDKADKTVNPNLQKGQEKTTKTARRNLRPADAAVEKNSDKKEREKPRKLLTPLSKGARGANKKGEANKMSPKIQNEQEKDRRTPPKNSKAANAKVKKILDKEKELEQPLLLADANTLTSKGEEVQKTSTTSLRNSIQADAKTEEPLLLNLWSSDDILDDLTEIFTRSQDFLEKNLPPPSFEKPRGSLPSEYFENRFNKSYSLASKNQDKITFSGSLPYDDNIYAPNELNEIKVKEYFYNASKIHIGNDCYICAQRPKKATLEDYWKTIIFGNVSVIVSFSIDPMKGHHLDFDPGDYSLHRQVPVTIKGVGEITMETQELQFGPYTDKAIQLKKLEFKFQSQATDKLPERTIIEYELLADPNDILKLHGRFFDFLEDIIDSEKKKNEGPIFVHCESGNLMSALFIALSGLRNQVKKQINEKEEPIVNFEEFLNEIRKQRYGLIGKTDHLTFLYDRIKTYAKSLRNQKTSKPETSSMEMVTS